MYFYKFNGGTKPIDTFICNEGIDGYISFGTAVDWTKFDFDGQWLVPVVVPEPILPDPIPPTPEQIKANLINAVQSHLDATARAKGYDNILSAVTYAGDNTVPQFSLEGQAYKTWRSQVWAYCYAYLADVQAGTKAVPTSAELIALLPTPPAPIEWIVYGNNA